MARAAGRPGERLIQGQCLGATPERAAPIQPLAAALPCNAYCLCTQSARLRLAGAEPAARCSLAEQEHRARRRRFGRRPLLSADRVRCRRARRIQPPGRIVHAARSRYHEPALTRSDLITELAASNPHLRAADVELIVTTIFDQITAALARGDRRFGAFTVRRRDARMGHNPRTGEAVSIAEKAVPFFKAGKMLHGRLNRSGRKPSRAATTEAAPADGA